MPDCLNLIQLDQEGLFKSLSQSWVSLKLSSEAMMRVTVNEDVFLVALNSMPFVHHLFSCDMIS